MKQQYTTILKSFWSLILGLFLVTQTACTESCKLGFTLDSSTNGMESKSDDDYTTDEDLKLDALYKKLDKLESALDKKTLSDDCKKEISSLVQDIKTEACEEVKEDAYKALMESRHYYQKDSEDFIASKCSELGLTEDQKKWIRTSIKIHIH